MSTFLFWLATGPIGYLYAGFPLLVLLRARLRPRPHRIADVTPGERDHRRARRRAVDRAAHR